MGAQLSEEQIQALAATTKPYSAALLWWEPQRHMNGADQVERQHQRRILGLRQDGVIAVLCPGAGSDTLAGIAIMTVSVDEAEKVMADDPCVQAGMIRCEIQPCVGFPGDSLPG